MRKEIKNIFKIQKIDDLIDYIDEKIRYNDKKRNVSEDYLKSFLQISKQLAYGSNDVTWSEFELDFAIIIKRLVVAERVLREIYNCPIVYFDDLLEPSKNIENINIKELLEYEDIDELNDDFYCILIDEILENINNGFSVNLIFNIETNKEYHDIFYKRIYDELIKTYPEKFIKKVLHFSFE